MKKATLFYDGYCALCQFWVKFLLKRDHRDRFRFAAFDSEAAKTAGLEIPPDATPDTVILHYLGKTYTHSDAALLALQLLGGGWKIVGILRWIPRFLRDPVYRLIAAYRYRLFGKKDTCLLPDEKWKDKLLD